MKRLQIMIDEDLDADLERMAAEQRTSKAALIREFVRRCVHPLPPLEQDPLYKWIGALDSDPADVDEVVYGPVEASEREPARIRDPEPER
jgi:hypothetical protein